MGTSYSNLAALLPILICRTGRIAALTAVLLGSSRAAGVAQVPHPDTLMVYKRFDESALRLHVFLPPEPASGGAVPVIIFFFGGGWNGGNPSQFYPQASHFAAREMIAISAEYRTRTSHGTTPFESVEDAMSAIRWIRSHASELGIDPNRLVAAGGSAGGQLAAATGIVRGLDRPGEDTLVSRRPNALMLFNPVIDNGPGGYGYDRIGPRFLEFSPLHNIDSTAPPTLVLLGTDDHLIPVRTARRLQQAMRQAGVRSELRLFERQGHGFFNHRDGGNLFYELTLQAADEFLQSLGYLDPPTVGGSIGPALAPEPSNATATGRNGRGDRALIRCRGLDIPSGGLATGASARVQKAERVHLSLPFTGMYNDGTTHDATDL